MKKFELKGEENDGWSIIKNRIEIKIINRKLKERIKQWNGKKLSLWVQEEVLGK